MCNTETFTFRELEPEFFEFLHAKEIIMYI